jgi:mono/diheme cytochrome c family protein
MAFGLLLYSDVVFGHLSTFLGLRGQFMVRIDAWRIALGLALILTGCGKGQRKIHIPSLGSTDGIKLYNSHCASCHNQIGTSTKKNKTAAQITAAISSVEQMKSLGFLTSAEIQAIATALVSAAPPPPNPTALTATPNSAAAITLSWTSGGGSTVDYRISYQLGATAPANCSTGTLISDSLISGTTHQVTGLSANTQYSFRVCAINDKTTPEVSSGVTVSGTTLTNTAPPPNPTALTATPKSVSAITLSWTSGAGSTVDYRISYQLGPTAPATCAAGTLISESAISGTSHQVTGLTTNTQYSFRVCAINDKTTPEVSSGVTVSGTTLQTPPPPNGVTLYGSKCASCHNPLATSTKKNKTAAQITAAIGSVAQMSSKPALTALTATEIQAIATALVDTTPLPPPNPIALSAVPNSMSAITLSWTSGGGSTVDYRISYQLGATAPATCAAGTTIPESAISGTSHQVTGLSANTQYSFRVCAINNKTTPEVSSGVAVSAKTLINTAPPPNPTALTATPNSAAAITLSWTSGGGSTVDYRISYQLGATAPATCSAGTKISESAISGTSHQVTGLTTNSQYSFRICAINGKTTPDVSSGVTVSAKTLINTAPPPNPTALTATPNSISTITLSWTSGAGSTVDFRISYQLGATAPATCAAGTLISESAISGTSHQVTGLTTNSQYSFRICAINGKTTPDVSSGVTVSARTVQAPPPPNGVTLYGSKCASCHNPLADSTKKNKTAAQITAAISSVAQMSSKPALTALTPAEIQAIATALIDTTPPPQSRPLRYVAPIGTRVYVVSTFTDLFLPEVAQRTAADTPILYLINTLLLDKTGALGGPCRKYETRCVGDLNENIGALMLPAPNTLRKGYMTRACEEILAKDRSVQNALSRAGITLTSTADTTNLRRLFDHFYPGHNPNTVIINSLISLVSDSRTKGLGDLNAWRYTMVPLCVGSALELL